MTDTRFTTEADDIDHLCQVLDIDGIDELETLLTMLFARPVTVDRLEDEGGVEIGVEVILSGNDASIGTEFGFPLSVIEIARSGVETNNELGPYSEFDHGPATLGAGPGDIDDIQLIGALQRALGQVRIFNLMSGGVDE